MFNSYNDKPHHISSANEMYNNLADFIIQQWSRVTPDINPAYYGLADMVEDLANKAAEGIALRDKLADQANRNINEDFARMRSLLASLENNSNG